MKQKAARTPTSHDAPRPVQHALSPDADVDRFASQVKPSKTQACVTNQLLSDKLEIRRG